MCRSSHRKCSIKKAALKDFAIFKGKHLCWSLFLIKAFRPAILLKRNSNTGVLLRILQNILRTPVLKNICECLLLKLILVFVFIEFLLLEEKLKKLFFCSVTFEEILLFACTLAILVFICKWTFCYLAVCKRLGPYTRGTKNEVFQ